MYRILLLIVLPLLVVPTVAQTVNAIGPYPCYFFIQPLDKVEYDLGETVRIKVQHCREDSFDTATLMIADGMKMHPFEEDFWQKVESGDGIIHKESKQASYGDVEFNYTIPKSSPTYRYLVLITPGQMGGADFAYIFSKENASKIVISDVKVLNSEVRQGEDLTFGLKVTDGVGNPLPFVVLNPSANYVTCDGRGLIQNSIAVLEKSEDERKQYLSSGIMWGWLPIPIGVAGTYELDIEATTSNYVNKGWAQAVVKDIKFEVLGTADENRLDLFADAHERGYVNSTHVRVGDPLFITGKLYLTHCIPSPETSLPVKVEVREMMIDMDEVVEQFGRTELNYEEISCYNYPSLCSSRTIETAEMTATLVGSQSDFIGLRQELIEKATRKLGEYMFVMTAELNGVKYQDSVSVQVHNVKDYIVNAEGKEFRVVVDAWYSNPQELTFDKENKKIVATVDVSRDPKAVEISLPHELLDGQLTVLVNGERVIDEQNDQKARGFLKKDDIASHITVFVDNGTANIEIIGTTVVPEFPLAVTILSASIAILIYGSRFLRIR